MKTARIAVLLALALMLLAAAPVSAGAPIVDTVGDDIEYAMPEDFCPGIEVRNHEVYTGTYKNLARRRGQRCEVGGPLGGCRQLVQPGEPGCRVNRPFCA